MAWPRVDSDSDDHELSEFQTGCSDSDDHELSEFQTGCAIHIRFVSKSILFLKPDQSRRGLPGLMGSRDRPGLPHGILWLPKVLLPAYPSIYIYYTMYYNIKYRYKLLSF